MPPYNLLGVSIPKMRTMLCGIAVEHSSEHRQTMPPRGHTTTYPVWGVMPGSYSNPNLGASLQLKLPPRTLASEKKQVATVTLRSSGPEVMSSVGGSMMSTHTNIGQRVQDHTMQYDDAERSKSAQLNLCKPFVGHWAHRVVIGITGLSDSCSLAASSQQGRQFVGQTCAYVNVSKSDPARHVANIQHKNMYTNMFTSELRTGSRAESSLKKCWCIRTWRKTSTN